MTPALTLAIASRIVDAALDAARQQDLPPLSVAVLDAGGHLVAFKREDDSGILRPQIAVGKAWGALGMGTGSRALVERAATHPSFIGALAAASEGRLVPVPGGVLVRSGSGSGAVLGAVGVSGAMPDQDESCAVKGIEAAGLRADVG